MGRGMDYAQGVGGGAASGAATGAYFGPWGALIGGGIGAGLGALNVYNQHSVADTYKGQLDDVMGKNAANGEALKKFYLQRGAAAQAHYAPLDHMFKAAYGTEGIQAPVTPRAAGTPLGSMFNGGR